jgi:4-hydroxy-3-polyprenylbenzoate decarboxylase
MKKAYLDIWEFLDVLEEHGELVRIRSEVSPNLEITEIYLRHIKRKDGGKALLFEKVKGSSIPVLINALGSFQRVSLALGSHGFDAYAAELHQLLNLSIPHGVWKKFQKAWGYRSFLKFPPVAFSGSPPCQEVVLTGDEVDLSLLPVLTCWPLDGGAFITLPLVFTRSLHGNQLNMGMYRMQIYDSSTAGMHWQIHKDGSHFHGEYIKAGKTMEVAVAIGTDPATLISGAAPLPPGVYEPIFAGFLRGQGVPMVPCKTVDLEVPANAEIILEGFVEPGELRDEGPFGDHTGYYTPKEPYPVFHVKAITMKRKPLYLATVVGQSPMEDCYMAHAIERLFLPLLQHIAPEVVDQHLPWDGNFHNCQIFAIRKHYPFQGRRLMSHIWGFTQASFSKIVITASEDAPIHDDALFMDYFLDHLDISRNLFITEGIVDALDHSATEKLYGGKLGIDISHPMQGEPGFGEPAPTREIVKTDWVDKELAMLDPSITGCNPYGLSLRNPVLILRVNKSKRPFLGKNLASKIFQKVNLKPYKIFVLVDEKNKNLRDYHRILWRVFNNTDAGRDLFIEGDRALVDATYKLCEEGYNRQWPPDMEMSDAVVQEIDKRFDSESLGLGVREILERGK